MEWNSLLRIQLWQVMSWNIHHAQKSQMCIGGYVWALVIFYFLSLSPPTCLPHRTACHLVIHAHKDLFFFPTRQTDSPLPGNTYILFFCPIERTFFQPLLRSLTSLVSPCLCCPCSLCFSSGLCNGLTLLGKYSIRRPLAFLLLCFSAFLQSHPLRDADFDWRREQM